MNSKALNPYLSANFAGILSIYQIKYVKIQAAYLIKWLACLQISHRLKTPFLGVDEFANIGYQLVIYPITMQRVAMNAVIKSLSKLKDVGSAESFVDKMQTRAELYKMLEYSPEVD